MTEAKRLDEAASTSGDDPNGSSEPVKKPAFDRDDPAFRERLRRDSLVIANSPQEREIMDWIEEVTADMDWDR
jgi:hypothetical protein